MNYLGIRGDPFNSVADGVLEDMEYFPDYAYVVAGDFNVGHSDKRKNGKELDTDCTKKNCGTKDRYDDTHALLSEGLVGNLKMKNLVKHITTTTYPGYPGSPIDNIYVAGKLKNKFSEATKSDHTFGSDHVPVWTIYKSP